MYFVGSPSVMARRLVEVTREAMFRGIRAVRPGATLGDVGHAIQEYAEGQRFSVVREYCGHGIGRVYHDEPQVLHYGQPGQGVVLRPGMGVFLGQSTRVYNRATGEISYGSVPPYSVVVSGQLPAKDGSHSLYCAVIVKQVDKKTLSKTSINELLRGLTD